MALFIQISDPLSAVGQELARIDALLAEEIRAANAVIGARVSGEAKRILQTEVYDVPIPLTAGADRKLRPSSAVRGKTTKGKHGQWRRTGATKRAESFSVGASSVTLHNNQKSAASRAALGGPNPPNAKGRKAGEQRPQTDKPAAQRSRTKAVGNWQERAAMAQEKWIRSQYEAAIMRALRRAGRRM